MGEKMMYHTVFDRSFSRSDQKKLGYAAFLGCLLIGLSFCLVFRPNTGPQPIGVDSVSKRTSVVCNSGKRSDFCEINGGDIRIDAKTSTVFIYSSFSSMEENSGRFIRPYARKEDENAMRRVRGWSVKPVAAAAVVPQIQCSHNHSAPAVLFSLGGYSLNNYHDYTDIIVPLYSTAQLFDGQVKFLVTNGKPIWISKFKTLLQKLSNYDVIDIDNEENVHCFQSTTVIVGLKRSSPRELSIDYPSESPYSIKHFREFLRSAYSLNKSTAVQIDDGKRIKPRLLILSRNRTRAFKNTEEIAWIARNLTYEVVVAEADGRNEQRFAEIVNSCDVMMGVHGAGLTNMVFLPENAVLIQIIPFGGVDWVARATFGEPSGEMNIRYLEYKIKKEESSLIQQYPPEHEVLNNPSGVSKKGWFAFKEVYLDKQDVIINVNRFRLTLLRALELLQD